MQERKIVGVDTHKNTLACYCDGKFREFKTTAKSYQQIIEWAGNDVSYAVEGSYCYGQPFVTHLIKKGCEVFEVNPLLTKNWRNAIAVSNPKNDYGDAKVISIFAAKSKLEKVSLDTVELKEKLTARKSLVKQKTKITNQLKMIIMAHGEKLPFKDLTTKKAIKYLKESENIIYKINGDILEKIMNGIKILEKEIESQIPEKAKKLTTLKGVSNIMACTIYAETKGMLKTPASLANYAGIAPIDCSSGKTTKMKTNKKGNRVLNCAFYSLSVHQIRFDDNARKYYEKKIAEGKSPRRARKAVARNLVNIIFRILTDN